MVVACLDLYIYKIVTVTIITTSISHFSIDYKKYNTNIHVQLQKKTYKCFFFFYPVLHYIFICFKNQHYMKDKFLAIVYIVCIEIIFFIPKLGDWLNNKTIEVLHNKLTRGLLSSSPSSAVAASCTSSTFPGILTEHWMSWSTRAVTICIETSPLSLRLYV